jgi:hypothetical protein
MLRACSCGCSNGSAALAELSEQQQSALLQCHFLFSLVWSIGANTDDEGRRTFDGLLRKLLAGDAPPELAAYVKAPEVSSWSNTRSMRGCCRCGSQCTQACLGASYGRCAGQLRKLLPGDAPSELAAYVKAPEFNSFVQRYAKQHWQVVSRRV